jgi:flagellar basal body-associated protein FliL
MITNKPALNKKKKKNKSVNYSFFVILLMAIVLISYYFIANRESKPVEVEKVSRVQEVLLRDLSSNYPPSPKEVIVYYSELNQVMLSDTYTEEEQTALFQKIRELFDDELVANMTEEEYFLKYEGRGFKEKKG